MKTHHFFTLTGLLQVLFVSLIGFGGFASSRSAVTYGLFGFVISLGLMAFVAHFSGDDK